MQPNLPGIPHPRSPVKDNRSAASCNHHQGTWAAEELQQPSRQPVFCTWTPTVQDSSCSILTTLGSETACGTFWQRALEPISSNLEMLLYVFTVPGENTEGSVICCCLKEAPVPHSRPFRADYFKWTLSQTEQGAFQKPHDSWLSSVKGVFSHLFHLVIPSRIPNEVLKQTVGHHLTTQCA